MTMARKNGLRLRTTTRRGQYRFRTDRDGNDDDDDHRGRYRFRTDREDGDDDMDIGHGHRRDDL